MAARRPLHLDLPSGALAETAADDTVGIDIAELVELAGPPAPPPAGFVRLYARDDHRLYRMDFTGVEVLLGEGGGGPCPPNPRDAFQLFVSMALADTTPAQSDASLVAFAFADTNAAMIDALRLGLSFPDTAPALADAVTRLGIALAEALTTPTDTGSVAFTFPESTATPADAATVAFTFPESTSAPADLLAALRAVIAETNAAPTETVQLRTAFAESNAALTDAVSKLAVVLTDTSPASSDAFTALRIAHTDTNGALADAVTFALSALYADSTASPADALTTLRLTLTEAAMLPSDAHALRITHAESSAAQSDALTTLRALYAETVAAQSEALALRIRAVPAEPLGAYGVGAYGALPYGGQAAPKGRLDEINGQVSDARTAQVRYWAQNASAVNSTGGALVSGSSTAMAPANATGQRDGTTATVKTNLSLADTTNPVALLSSQFGPAALLLPPNITSQRLRVYFSIPARTAALDTIEIQYRTDGVTNSDTGWTTVYTHTGTAAVNFLTTPFDWNLVPVLTQAQADALVMRVRYLASVVASPEAQVNLDAWALEATTAL